MGLVGNSETGIRTEVMTVSTPWSSNVPSQPMKEHSLNHPWDPSVVQDLSLLKV